MKGKVFVGLGSNQGDRKSNLYDALDQLFLKVGRILSQSSIYETPPLGFEAVQQFYNMVVELETELGPREVLNRLLAIELKLGRERQPGEGYSSRSIDLDLLFYHEMVIDEPEFHLPHQGIPKRKFVLVPMVEIAPYFVHPVLLKSMVELEKICPDDSEIRMVE